MGKIGLDGLEYRDNQDGSWSSWAGHQSSGERTSGTAPNDDGSGARRNSVQSGTQSTKATAPTEKPDLDGDDDRELKDSDVSSASGKKDSPKTGEDYVPEYSGASPIREYEWRVRLFEVSTGIDESYRAQSLMERLSGASWQATESLDLQELKNPKGVERLLAHLWQELEPLELLYALRVFLQFPKTFLWVSGIPELQGDSAIGLRRAPNGSGPERTREGKHGQEASGRLCGHGAQGHARG